MLTHHARESLEMQGGNVFHFVTDGIEAALDMARRSAGEKDVLLSGGVSTVRQYLKARLIDELHIAVSPIILGSGERLFEGVDLLQLGYQCTTHICSEKAMHIVVRRGA